MKRLVLGLLAAASLALAAPDDSPRRYAALARLTPAAGDSLQALSLPWPVLQASRSAGLSDLRIFDGQGQAVPLAWAPEPVAAEQRRSLAVPRFAWPQAEPGTPDLQLQLSRNGAVVSLRSTPGSPAARTGESRVWLLDLSGLGGPDRNTERLSGLRLDWPRREGGLSSTVSAEASDDGQRWNAVTQAQLLDLNTGEQALGLKTITWPGGADRPRYLRLHFDLPLALTVSEVQLTRAGNAPALQQQAVRFEPVAAASGQPAFWQLDLQGPIAPRALALQLPEPNGLLSLRLEQRPTLAEPWRPVARFVAWRLQRGGRESESAPVALPQAAPARYWRLMADEGATALQARPLAARLDWQAPRLVFLARGTAGELQLAIGREQAPAVALPLASLMPAYQPGDELKLPDASLGALAAQAEPGLPQRLAEASAEDQRRWALWAVLIAAVVGLGLLARRMLRQITPPPS